MGGASPDSSDEGVMALIGPALEAWNRGDLDAVIARIHPDIAWHTALLLPDVEPVYRGHEGVRRFWATFVEPWEEIRVEIVELLGERGTREEGVLVVTARFRARGREGIELDLEVNQMFRTTDGLLIEFRAFQTPREALAEAGLG